jgi:hypothetical protein
MSNNKFHQGDRVRSTNSAHKGKIGTVWGDGTTNQKINAVEGPIYAIEFDSIFLGNSRRGFSFEKHLEFANQDDLRRELREAEEKVAYVRRRLGDG